MTPWIAIASALWLGILTSVSPCPLASNIAAISLIGRRVGQTQQVLLSGLLYTLGRTLAYVGLAVLILAGLLASGEIARFLQRYLNQILGPVLILVGMLLLGLLGETLSFSLAGQGVQERASKGSIWWASVIGLLFAPVLLPGIGGPLLRGTADTLGRAWVPAGAAGALWHRHGIPVMAFAFLIAFAAQRVGKAFDRLTQVEWWVRTITGAVFVLAGIYYCLTCIYGISFA